MSFMWMLCRVHSAVVYGSPLKLVSRFSFDLTGEQTNLIMLH